MLACQRTLSSLELPRAVVANGLSASTSISAPHSTEKQPIDDGSVSGEVASLSLYNGRPRPKVHDPARDLSIQVLEKFSLVTRFARETTSQLLRESLNNGYGDDRRDHNLHHHDYSYKPSTEPEKAPEEVPVVPDPLEVIFCSL